MAPAADLRDRRSSTCTACRLRRIACYQGTFRESGPCLRCEKRGIPCVAVEEAARAEREAAQATELRSQLSRLDVVLSRVESDNCDEAQPEHHVPFLDVIATFTRMCTEQDILLHDVRSAGKLIDKCMLARTCYEAMQKLVVPERPRSAKPQQLVNADLNLLIALLPPWSDVSRLLLDIWPKHWSFTYDVLFPPTWPAQVQACYQSRFQQKRNPHFVAELFACLAMVKCATARGSDEAEELQRESDFFAACAKRALELLPCIEMPSLEAVRALFLLSSCELLFAPSTEFFAEGWRHLFLGLSIADQLGLNRPDNEYDGESPLRAFERRALVMCLTRSEWNFQSAYGRPGFISTRHPRASPPNDLRDEDLPEDTRRHPWRFQPLTMLSVRLRFEMARLHQEINDELFGERRWCDYRKVGKFAERITQFEMSLPKGWLIVEDSLTREISFAMPDAQLPKWEVSTRYQTIAQLAKLGVALHRPFVSHVALPNDLTPAFDLQYHRRELRKYARVMLRNIAAFAMRLNVPFVAFWLTALDSVIAAAFLIALEPLDPLSDRCRAELGAVLRHFMLPDAPVAAQKVAITAQTIMSCSVEELQAFGQPGLPSIAAAKRARTGHVIQGSMDRVTPIHNSVDPSASLDTPCLPVPFPCDGALPSREPPIVFSWEASGAVGSSSGTIARTRAADGTGLPGPSRKRSIEERDGSGVITMSSPYASASAFASPAASASSRRSSQSEQGSSATSALDMREIHSQRLVPFSADPVLGSRASPLAPFRSTDRPPVPWPSLSSGPPGTGSSADLIDSYFEGL